MQFSGMCLITENVPALAAFYERLFTCKAEGDATHTELTIGGLELAIFSRTGMDEMAKGCMEDARFGNFTLLFKVDDVDAEYERLKTLSVEFVKLPATHSWGSRSLWFRDPDGNIIDFWSRVAMQP